MPHYEIIIYWNATDRAFVAEVPELTDCAAEGDTQGEALANVQTAIQEWVADAKAAGREVPQPRGRLIFA